MRRLPLIALALAAAALPAAPASAIVGGRDASRPYPYMAALLVDGTFNCGASLVAPEWALTAAHCAVGEGGRPMAPSQFGVVLGRTALSGPGGEQIGISEVHVHELYGRGRHPNSSDVALLRLQRPSLQRPIALANPNTQRALWTAGKRSIVTGWGATDPFFGGASEDLQEVDVPMVDDAHCQTTQVIVGYDGGETQVCAGELYGTKDSCYGDSGGPLMVPDGAGTLVQVGVVSYGFSCGMPTQYGVYARVADEPLHSWIAAKTAPPPPPAATPPAALAPAQPWTKPKPAKKKTRTVTCKRRKGSRRCTCPKGYRRSKAKGSRRCVKLPRKSARR